jgi:A/G-specific adenine glycosylase
MLKETRERAQALCRWYEKNARPLPFRQTRDAYRIWVSEIMAQQTRMDALIPYYERFVQRFPTIQALAAASEDEVLGLWQGLGYYARARNLLRAARVVCGEYGGELPKDVKALKKLPGIGAYTAAAIASIAFECPEPAVDGNALRVFARLFAIEDDVRSPQAARAVWALMHEQMRHAKPSVFTQAVMELGALVCLPSAPQCGICPLAAHCEALRTGRVGELPLRAPNPAQRVEARVVMLLFSPSGAVLLRRRTERLLHGLWEFPGFADARAMQAWLCANDIALTDEAREALTARHVFTHIVWEMRAMTAQSANTPAIEGMRWVFPADFDAHAMPSAMRAFREYAARGPHGAGPKGRGSE